MSPTSFQFFAPQNDLRRARSRHEDGQFKKYLDVVLRFLHYRSAAYNRVWLTGVWILYR